MAYLKGGTVVDGNLYVEGSLRVNSVTDSSGKEIVRLNSSSAAVSDRIVKFIGTGGNVVSALVTETHTPAEGTVTSVTHTIEAPEFLLKLNDESSAKMKMSGTDLVINLKGKDYTAGKEFTIGGTDLTIPYMARNILVTSDTSNLVGLNENGTQCGDNEVPVKFGYVNQ